MEALYGYVTEQKNTVQRDGPTMGGNVSMSPHADDRSTLKTHSSERKVEYEHRWKGGRGKNSNPQGVGELIFGGTFFF